MKSFPRCLLRLAAAAVVVVLPGCGGGGGGGTTTPNPVPTPRPSTTLSFNYSNLDPREALGADFSVNVADADVEILVDWTFASTDVDVFVTSTSCSTASFLTLFNQVGSCTSLIRGVSTIKPERTTGRLLQGNYRIYAANASFFGSPESGFIQVILRPR